jgi:hypothetical protein
LRKKTRGFAPVFRRMPQAGKNPGKLRKISGKPWKYGTSFL